VSPQWTFRFRRPCLRSAGCPRSRWFCRSHLFLPLALCAAPRRSARARVCSPLSASTSSRTTPPPSPSSPTSERFACACCAVVRAARVLGPLVMYAAVCAVAVMDRQNFGSHCDDRFAHVFFPCAQPSVDHVRDAHFGLHQRPRSRRTGVCTPRATLRGPFHSSFSQFADVVGVCRSQGNAVPLILTVTGRCVCSPIAGPRLVVLCPCNLLHLV
jgi:hypothetical protein